MKRTCSQCHQEKILKDDFYKHKFGRNGYRAECKSCSRAFRSQTPDAALDKTYRLRRRNRQFIWDFYSTHPCLDCGETDPLVLELDHCRGKKVAGVSQLVHNTRSLAVIQAEIEKCDVVCANCHRRRTAQREEWYSTL